MKHNKMIIMSLMVWVLIVAWCTKTVVQPTEELPTKDAMIQEELSIDTMEKDPVPTEIQDDTQAVQEVAPEVAMMKAGEYEEYSEWWVQSALADGKKVAIFFHASRCPSCRSLDEDINASIDALPENTVVFKIDYDTSSDLKKKYGVTTQHTVVTVDANMNMIEKNTGTSFKKLISLLQ